MLHDSSDVELHVDNPLEQLLPGSSFAVCPGIADFKERYSADVRHAPKGLQTVTVGEQVLRYESTKCRLWHKITRRKYAAFDRLSGMCDACKALDRLVGQDATSAAYRTVETSAGLKQW